MTCNVYWIRHKDHTNIVNEGYVGVSNNVSVRWNQHAKHSGNEHLNNAINKYGWDNLIKSVVVVADEAYCYELELKLRPVEQIGWNIAPGGNKPPISKTRGPNYISPAKGVPRSEDIKLKISLSKLGKKRPDMTGELSPAFKGHIVSVNNETGEEQKFAGCAEVENAGFCYSHVHKCVLGKRKSHKGHTFRRVTA